MATVRTHTFEGWADAETITTAGTGSGDAWNQVDLTAGGTIEGDTARAGAGTVSGRFVTTTTAGVATLRWAITEVAELYSRFYLYVPSTIAVDNRLALFETTGFSNLMRLQIIDSSGPKLRVFWNGDAGNATGTVPVDRDKWIRIETRLLINATTGRAEVRLFNAADSTSPSEVVSSGDVNTGTTNIGRCRFGWNNNVTDREYWLDAVQLDDAAWIGPNEIPESFPTRRSIVA